MLGVAHLKSVVLAVEVANAFPAVGGISDLSVGQEHERSMLVASALQDIFDVGERDDRFTVGILHGLGRLVIAMQWCQRDGKREVTTMEKLFEHVGLHHPEVGGILLESWDIPTYIVEAIVHHHDPSVVPHDEFEFADALHFTVSVLDELLGPMPGTAPLPMREDHLKKVAGVEKLMFWRRKLEEKVGHMREEMASA
jgi:HD-like signal output (HDOD) protein